MYDQSNCFITGFNNTLLYSYDGAINWKSVNSAAGSLPQGANYNNVVINNIPKVNGNIAGYFSLDSSSSLITFELLLGNVGAGSYSINPIICSNNNVLDRINSIHASNNAIYLAGKCDCQI
jgi:hypothetical protein